jgi:hypothetical protein
MLRTPVRSPSQTRRPSTAIPQLKFKTQSAKATLSPSPNLKPTSGWTPAPDSPSTWSHTPVSPLLRQKHSHSIIKQRSFSRPKTNRSTVAGQSSVEGSLPSRESTFLSSKLVVPNTPVLESSPYLENTTFTPDYFSPVNSSSPKLPRVLGTSLLAISEAQLPPQPPSFKESHHTSRLTRTASRLKRKLRKAASFASFGAIESPNTKDEQGNQSIDHREYAERFYREVRDIQARGYEREGVFHSDSELGSAIEDTSAERLFSRELVTVNKFPDTNSLGTEVLLDGSPVRTMRPAKKVQVVMAADRAPLEAIVAEVQANTDGLRRLSERITQFEIKEGLRDQELGNESATAADHDQKLYDTGRPPTPYSFKVQSPTQQISSVRLPFTPRLSTRTSSVTGLDHTPTCSLHRVSTSFSVLHGSSAYLLPDGQTPGDSNRLQSCPKSPLRRSVSSNTSPTRDALIRASVLTTSTMRSQLSAQWYRSPSERLGLKFKLTKLGGKAPWNDGCSGVTRSGLENGWRQKDGDMICLDTTSVTTTGPESSAMSERLRLDDVLLGGSPARGGRGVKRAWWGSKWKRES